MFEITHWNGTTLYVAENASDVREAVIAARDDGAVLTGAVLRGADLRDAVLTGADLIGAYGYVRINVSALIPLTKDQS